MARFSDIYRRNRIHWWLMEALPKALFAVVVGLAVLYAMGLTGCSQSTATDQVLKLSAQLQAEMERKNAEHEKTVKELNDRLKNEIAAHKAASLDCQRLQQEAASIKAMAEKEIHHANEQVRMKNDDLNILKGKLKNLGFPEPN